MPASVNPFEILGGLILSAVVAVAGYRRAALSKSGVAGALITGTILCGLGGWEWGMLLIAFFISSSALSHYRESDKENLAEKFAKGHQRDMGQALANAGVASALAIVGLFWNHPLLYIACAGSMAAVNADTWATELGVLSRRPPRLITTGQPVDVGTSGGVTALGMVASIGGAGLIGLFGGAGGLVVEMGLAGASLVLLSAVVGGLIGALCDSVLGATIQAIYWCDICEKETEQRTHRCGTPTRRVRGLPWLNNDLVNFLASLIGAASAMAAGSGIAALFGINLG
jgi:uncharacterized protein (TIGR00297 family)